MAFPHGDCYRAPVQFVLPFLFCLLRQGASLKADQYLLEDSAKNVITAESGILSPYKNRIKEFLNGNVVLIDLFTKDVSRLNDIPTFVDRANGLSAP